LSAVQEAPVKGVVLEPRAIPIFIAKVTKKRGGDVAALPRTTEVARAVVAGTESLRVIVVCGACSFTTRAKSVDARYSATAVKVARACRTVRNWIDPFALRI
jgi:hypothetical protein